MTAARQPSVRGGLGVDDAIVVVDYSRIEHTTQPDPNRAVGPTDKPQPENGRNERQLRQPPMPFGQSLEQPSDYGVALEALAAVNHSPRRYQVEDVECGQNCDPDRQ
jgi:hypothetical protein